MEFIIVARHRRMTRITVLLIRVVVTVLVVVTEVRLVDTR